MLAKKYDWAVSQQYIPPAPKPRAQQQVSLNVQLRKKCFLLVVLILLLAAVGTVQNERIVTSGYQYVELQQELQVLNDNNQKLHLEIAQLRSLERIQAVATNKLGMTMPEYVFEATLGLEGSGNLAAVQLEGWQRKL